MTRTSALALLIALAAIFATAAIWLAFDNPTISAVGRSGHHQCAAPYDTVLLGADNVRGGWPLPGDKETAAACRTAGKKRFALSAASGALALVAIGGLVVVRRRRPTPSSPV